jgi:hypothetical protein
MRLYTIVAIRNDTGHVHVRHVMAHDHNHAAVMAAENADIKFIAIFLGWQDSFLPTEGEPREATDILAPEDEN